MIESSAIPFAVRSMLRDVEEIDTAEEWVPATRKWNNATKNWAVIMRSIGEKERARVTAEGPEELQKLALEARRDGDKATPLWLAMAYLSDTQLDLIIKSFDLKPANDSQ